MCRCECHEEFHGGHYEECGGHHGRRMSWGFPLMTVEEEVKGLEEMKEALEKRLEVVNKRLETLKR